MHYRNFGTSDLVTSAIGFGGWPMGRGHYGSFDDDEVVRAVHLAVDLGVTLFDTAAGYGEGEGEKLLGRALEGRRDRVVLVSKGGLMELREGTRERNSSREALTKGLEDSLTRLGTDYLDLYLIHWPDVTRPFSEPMEALAHFREQGKIRYGGVSNFSPQQMRESMDTFPVVCNQVGYHLFDFRPEAEVFPFCRENGLGVMVYGPMAHGLLTGTMTPGHHLRRQRLEAHPRGLWTAPVRGRALPGQPQKGRRPQGDSRTARTDRRAAGPSLGAVQSGRQRRAGRHQANGRDRGERPGRRLGPHAGPAR